jgi:hypothetical protein
MCKSQVALKENKELVSLTFSDYKLITANKSFENGENSNPGARQ